MLSFGALPHDGRVMNECNLVEMSCTLSPRLETTMERNRRRARSNWSLSLVVASLSVRRREEISDEIDPALCCYGSCRGTDSPQYGTRREGSKTSLSATARLLDREGMSWKQLASWSTPSSVPQFDRQQSGNE